MKLTKRLILLLVLFLAGGMILAGTALSWSLEGQLLYRQMSSHFLIASSSFRVS